MLKIQNKLVDELIEYDNNPRLNDEAVDVVAKSIKEFGFKVPVIIDENNIIVAGHTRVKACKRLGIKEVPCIIADDLTEDQLKAFRLADNKTHEFALWDDEKLYKELEAIKMDMFQFGFEDLNNLAENEVFDDDYIEVRKILNDYKRFLNMDSYKDNKFIYEYLDIYERLIIPVVKGKPRMRAKEFIETYGDGTFIVKMAKHLACIKNGKLLDTWDSSDKTIYTAWRIKQVLLRTTFFETRATRWHVCPF